MENDMFKDIAVLLETDAKADVVTPFAISFAAAFGAHLTGIGIAVDIMVPAPMMSEIPSNVFAAAFEKAKLDANRAGVRFERDGKLAGVSTTNLLIAATKEMADDEFSILARHFDLTLLQQSDPDSVGDDKALIEAALFGSGRPVLIIPYTHKAAFKCNRAVVAWDRSAPATRAIAGALPLLQLARSVQLVIVNEKKKHTGIDLPGFNITRHLARHSINAELQELPSAGDVANTLLSHLADSDADLLVMGAYGHSRLHEFILGGATREILSAMTSPVLMAH
jgi:nucleotide-binding universal stress UspA family protein